MDFEKKDITKVKYGRNRTQVKNTKGVLIPVHPGSNNRHKDGTPSPFAEENYERRNERRAATIREKCYNSFIPNRCIALTLTFDKSKCNGFDPRVIKDAHKAFHCFIQRVNRRFEGFTYVATFSKQNKSGNWHYHMICNFAPNVSGSEIEKLWQYGFIRANRICTYKQLKKWVEYLIKNLDEFKEDKQGIKGYLASRSAKSDTVLSSLRVSDSPKYDTACKRIKQQPLKKIYSVSGTAGIQRTTVSSAGVRVTEYIPGAELTNIDILNGYSRCVSTTTCYSSPVRFYDEFPYPKTAARRNKKKAKSPKGGSKRKSNKPLNKHSHDTTSPLSKNGGSPATPRSKGK